MKKKILNIAFAFVVLITFSGSGAVYAQLTPAEQAALDAVNAKINTQAASIAKELGVEGGTFSSSQRTMTNLSNGLLRIENLKTQLQEQGVAATKVAEYENILMTQLKGLAKASYEQENIGMFNFFTADTINEVYAREMANFANTLGNIYKQNDLDEDGNAFKVEANAQVELANRVGQGDYSYTTTDGRVANAPSNKKCTWSSGPDKGTYCLLAPLGDLVGKDGKVAILEGEGGMSGYLDGLFRAGIMVATGLALVMIVIGGLQYVTTDAWGGKSAGRERISQALIGLLLALGTVVIVSQLNPLLLRNDLALDAEITLTSIDAPDVSLGLDELQIDKDEGSNGIGGNSFYSNQTPGVTTSGVNRLDPSQINSSRLVDSGAAHIDRDASPGAYKVQENPNGPYFFGGKGYKSVGTEHLGNARSDVATTTAAMKSGGKWVGVKTNSAGDPIINPDGTLIGVLSYGNGSINGDRTAFIAMSKEQLAKARSIKPGFGLGGIVILEANGLAIQAIYADNAGSRPASKYPNGHVEVSPAAAAALKINPSSPSGKISVYIP